MRLLHSSLRVHNALLLGMLCYLAGWVGRTMEGPPLLRLVKWKLPSSIRNAALSEIISLDVEPLTPDQVPTNCTLLRNACVDQQTLIMMADSYSPRAFRQEPLPMFAAPFSYAPPISLANADVWVDYPSFGPLPVRPRWEPEAAPDLASPEYVRSVVPVIFRSIWYTNFAHTVFNGAAWLYTHLVASNHSWARHAKVVLDTPLGGALPSHWPWMVGPMAPAHKMESLADFSARLPAECFAHGTAQSAVPLSCLRRRCYAQMLACAGHDIDAEMRVDAWQAAQHVVQHYKTTTGLPPSRVSYPDACPQGGSCLRVLFLRRSTSTAMRQLLNLAELMERCNGWRHTDAATGKTYTASCAAYETSDLLHDIAAVQTADLVVSTHGAQLLNAGFMRPGSAAIEVQAFDQPYICHTFRQDPTLQLRWWRIYVTPAWTSPGELEQQLPHPRLYKAPKGLGALQMMRDKNVKLPWEGFEQALAAAAPLIGKPGSDGDRCDSPLTVT